MKNACKVDKENWIESKCNEAEEAAIKNDTRTLFKVVRDLSNVNTSSKNVPIKSKSGKLLITEEEQLKRCEEHFSEVLNQPNPVEAPNLSNDISSTEDTDVVTEIISMDELRSAIKALKNNKSPGKDMITAELFKHGGDIVIEKLSEI